MRKSLKFFVNDELNKLEQKITSSLGSEIEFNKAKKEYENYKTSRKNSDSS